MIGLVYKDFLCLRKSAASYLFVVAIYGLLTVAGVWDGTILSTVLAVLISMLPYSCFSYDNIAKWELYGLSLPLRRSRIVLARYLTVLPAPWFFSTRALEAAVPGVFCLCTLTGKKGARKDSIHPNLGRIAVIPAVLPNLPARHCAGHPSCSFLPMLPHSRRADRSGCGGVPRAPAQGFRLTLAR